MNNFHKINYMRGKKVLQDKRTSDWPRGKIIFQTLIGTIGIFVLLGIAL